MFSKLFRCSISLFVFAGLLLSLGCGKSPKPKGRSQGFTVAQNELNPEEADRKAAFNSHMLAGYTAYNSRRYPEAVSSYQEALNIDPSSADAKKGLADSQAAMNGTPPADGPKPPDVPTPVTPPADAAKTDAPKTD